jgi:wyosine [tRNA(Phe)-imidazoG37] synthetase (radical SAM superfamily)
MVEQTQHTFAISEHPEKKKPSLQWPTAEHETAFGHPRDFLDNRFVYTVVSARARGLSIGINMNPDKWCNFDCPYCEVRRIETSRQHPLDIDIMAVELKKTLSVVHGGRLREQPWYQSLPDEMLRLRHVTLSGDGEPTFAPNFVEAVQAAIHVRAMAGFPFFKLVLITNATGLNQPHVLQGLEYFHRSDEVWAKLDAGTQLYLKKVNKTDVPLEKILSNILLLAKQRPVIIQSLFPSINGQEPATEEILEYALRLAELKSQGAQIPLVQIYSATRPTPDSICGHLSLKTLSRIAQTVRQVAGLKVEVF